MEREGKPHVLEGLDDSVHVSDLRRVGLEWEIDIDSSDAVSGHFCFASFSIFPYAKEPSSDSGNQAVTELVIVREETKRAKISGEGEDAALV